MISNKTLDDVAFRLAWLTMRDDEQHRELLRLAKEQGERDRERDGLIRRVDRYFRTHPDVHGLHMTCYDSEGRVQHYAILPDSVDGVALINLQETWRIDELAPQAEETDRTVSDANREVVEHARDFIPPIDDEGMMIVAPKPREKAREHMEFGMFGETNGRA